MHGEYFNEADVARRARRLLAAFFAEADARRRRTVLDRAFHGFAKDPRGLIDTAGAPADFASECVAKLLAYGCTEGHRHALSRLLCTICDDWFGTNPDPDYCELPRLLDARCALPNREEQRAWLETLIADCRAKVAKYASLAGVVRRAASASAGTDLDDQDDIALLRHIRRRAGLRGQEPQETRDYPHILEAFGQVPRAALLGQPGAGKSTTLRRLAADRAATALADPGAPLPVLVSLGDWTGTEPFADFLAGRLPGLGDALSALDRAGRLILLLDGLNEIPSARRAAKAASIRAYIQALDPATPVVVSCRGDDYVGELDLGLDTLTLRPLSPQRVRALLVHWLSRKDPLQGEAHAMRLFWQLAGDPALAGVLDAWLAAGVDEDQFWTAEHMPFEGPDVSSRTSDQEYALWWRHVTDPRGLLRLVANPFMLNMLYRVWEEGGGVLPRNRGDLFDLFVEILLRREGLCCWPGSSPRTVPRSSAGWRMPNQRSPPGASWRAAPRSPTALPCCKHCMTPGCRDSPTREQIPSPGPARPSAVPWGAWTWTTAAVSA